MTTSVQTIDIVFKMYTHFNPYWLLVSRAGIICTKNVQNMHAFMHLWRLNRYHGRTPKFMKWVGPQMKLLVRDARFIEDTKKHVRKKATRVNDQWSEADGWSRAFCVVKVIVRTSWTEKWWRDLTILTDMRIDSRLQGQRERVSRRNDAEAVVRRERDVTNRWTIKMICGDTDGGGRSCGIGSPLTDYQICTVYWILNIHIIVVKMLKYAAFDFVYQHIRLRLHSYLSTF